MVGVIRTTVVAALRHHAVAISCGLALVALAGALAPGASHGWWDWSRLIVAATSGALALAVCAIASHSRARLPALTLAAGLLIITVILSATFSSLTVLFALFVIALALMHLNLGAPASRVLAGAILGLLAPLWVWSAFDSWTRLLLLLLPVAVIGVVALEHALRADLVVQPRGSREAAWVLVLVLAAMLVGAALLSDVSPTWPMVGALAALALAGIDVLPARARFTDAVPSLAGPAVALLALGVCWLVAL